jgi:AcrR family transcriptional regulator
MPRPRKRAYHHGDLRNVVLAEASAVLGSAGAGAISVRGIAATIGVTPMALYKHFEDRDALLAALAMEGFESLERAIRKAAPAGMPSLERLRQGAVAYVAFAVAEPNRFGLMFGGVGPALAKEPVKSAARSAFSPLLECLEGCRRAGVLRGDTIAAERAIWSAAHGYATLWNSVPELMRGSRAEMRANAARMIDAILGGVASVK